jgi:hypothetical protein
MPVMAHSNIEFSSDKVIDELTKAKKIVVICGILHSTLITSYSIYQHLGAGISVAAGIPSFRGAHGLYSAKTFLPSSPQVNVVDLFSYQKLQVRQIF